MQFLIDILQKPIGKIEVEHLASLASDETFSCKQLIDTSLHQDEQIGFRAAWILERVYSNHQKQFLPYADYFLEHLPKQSNHSALRHYVKILAFMTGKKASAEIKLMIADYSTDSIVETVFAWLIDDKIPVAVKSHCLNILANFTCKHQWIKEELISTMYFLVDKESIAFFAKVKQIRKQLKVKS
ncbi:hypothetical protein [Pedobacter sp. Leaf132]|uniref:hypothetical protein n=1 Tax=Pedobacter sp. Leaf132 TaxID=2876557 RepID=UPI001E3AEC3B|nr:hypothetical protein [Pedobacter sp. Leaf132]